ncbi:MAG: hypothetical protein JO317_06000 [Verrucomicrobiae bacterium]|nr:hypothetical protein [Verrucomicrobiae bacterium]
MSHPLIATVPPAIQPPPRAAKKSVEKKRRSIDALLEPWNRLVSNSNRFFASTLQPFEILGQVYRIPRYHFIGPRAGGDYLRVGLFASLRGDETDALEALPTFIRNLATEPDLARGFELFLYPLSNPTGVEDGTRWSRVGGDLEDLFWRESIQPEIILLEKQIEALKFDGLISIGEWDGEGMAGALRPASLAGDVLEPALGAAAAHLAGKPAAPPVFRQKLGGVSASPQVRPRPFEASVAMPRTRREPKEKRPEALSIALTSLLAGYARHLAYAQGI